MIAENAGPNNYVPLPSVDVEQHGIEFLSLGLPQGFDEERLEVNVNRVRQIAKIGGLGDVRVIGRTGEKTDDTPSVIGIDDNGTAMAGSRKYHRRQPVTDGVTLMTNPNTKYIDLLGKPDVEIGLNVSERDERLRTSKSIKRQLDPVGHAETLGQTLSRGLHTAARLRHQGSASALIRHGMPSNMILPVASDIFEVTMTGHTYARSLVLYGLLYGVGEFVYSKSMGSTLGENNFTPLACLERRAAAQVLAKYSTLVKARA